MIRLSARLLLLCLVAVLGACASGPKFNEVKSALPTVPADQGRIYVYRSASMFGAAIQPEVKLNGDVVGKSQPGGFFFVDRPAGNYEVTTATETEKKVTFVLDKGEVKYIKTSPSFGVMVGRVIPELIDPAQGQPELEQTSYTGTPLQAAK